MPQYVKFVRLSTDGVRKIQNTGCATGIRDLGVLKRPPPHLHLADDVFLRSLTSGGCRAIVPVSPYNEALLNDLRTPVVWPELHGHVVVVQRDVIP